MKEDKLRILDIELKKWLDYIENTEGNTAPNDCWLQVAECCALMRCSEITFYRKCKSGELIYYKPSNIMVWLSDVAKYIYVKRSNA